MFESSAEVCLIEPPLHRPPPFPAFPRQPQTIGANRSISGGRGFLPVALAVDFGYLAGAEKRRDNLEKIKKALGGTHPKVNIRIRTT